MVSSNLMFVLFIAVFLGGSCNPTVWRKEVAMPLLQKEEIKFFNPVSSLCTQFQ